MRFFCFGIIISSLFGFLFANENSNLFRSKKLTPADKDFYQLGFIHNQNQDVTISKNQHDFILEYKYYQDNGGAISCRNLLISENRGNIFFEKNICPNSGGAVYAAQNCTISNNQNYSFTTNMASANPTVSTGSLFGGALFATNCSITNNLGKGIFTDNATLNKGGALYTTTNLSIKDNKGSILINQNQTIGVESLGGGIFSGNSVNIEGNSGSIQIKDNASSSGGAIFASQTLTISSNKKLIEISNNLAFGNAYLTTYNPGGGAFTTIVCTIENNPGGVIFNNNKSQRNGGAIYAKSIIIRNNGPVYFLNNAATWGGALLNLNSGAGTTIFLLSADNGDIIFNNNKATKLAPTAPAYRNALHSTPNMNLQIGASAGHSVVFYDPIENEHPTPSPVLLNSRPDQQGTILFSGVNVDPDATEEGNFFSYLRNTTELRRGILAVEDRAGLACYKLSQIGGALRLGNGAVICTRARLVPESGTPTTAGSLITLNNITINLPSVLSFKAKAPKIWIYPTQTGATFTEDPNPTIRLSGPLTLVNDKNEDPYDSLDLSKPLNRVPLLYLSDVTAQKIDSSQLDISKLNSGEHYGYQGIWSPYWVETTTITNPTSLIEANTKHKQLYADWTPLGYRPHPERRGEHIANTLWQSAYSALAGLQTFSYSNQESILEGSLQGIGLFIHQKNNEGYRGFRSHTTGYSATSSIRPSENHKFSLGFAQFFAKTKELESQASTSSHSYFSAMHLESPVFKDWMRFSLALAYMFSSQHTHYTYHGLLQGSSHGVFYNHTLAGVVSCIFFPQPESRSLHVYPFITALGIRGDLATFKEVGDHAREFSMYHPLTNVALPLGVRVSWKTLQRIPMFWLTEISYLPTLYRKNPELHSKLLISGGAWTTRATPTAYNACAIKVKSAIQLFPKVVLSFDYSLGISSSTQSHYLNGTSTIKF
ncbi:polymorphic outer membrane protein middle domain-containing protein [Chlamydia serpentis]|nr:polymorphic outer membrane protein middle domain-containing protein [Chlamydia serpentis]